MIVCERKYGQLEESSRIFGMVVMIVIDIPGLVSLHTLHIFCQLSPFHFGDKDIKFIIFQTGKKRYLLNVKFIVVNCW
jgi:hypothetical protein